MIPMSEELRQAVSQQPQGLELCDEQTQRVYVLMDQELYRQAMAALERQEVSRHVQEGLDDMRAGRALSLTDADRELRQEWSGLVSRP